MSFLTECFLNKIIEETDVLVSYFVKSQRNAIYSQELNKVTLAGGMMEEPMYSEDYPG